MEDAKGQQFREMNTQDKWKFISLTAEQTKAFFEESVPDHDLSEEDQTAYTCLTRLQKAIYCTWPEEKRKSLLQLCKL